LLAAISSVRKGEKPAANSTRKSLHPEYQNAIDDLDDLYKFKAKYKTIFSDIQITCEDIQFIQDSREEYEPDCECDDCDELRYKRKKPSRYSQAISFLADFQ
jgi:hypothetical protein